MRSVSLKRRILKTANIIFLSGAGLVFLIPLFWMLTTSLKTDSQFMSVPIVWIPKPFVWTNYIDAVKAFPFLRYFWNTAFISILKVLGTILTAALAAYAFTKLKWKGRDTIFYITVATMFLPLQVLVVPTYLIFSKLGWINTYLPLIVPAFLGGGAFGIFMLRQFFVSLPDELLESARMDGAPELRIFSSIVMPMAVPALTTLGIFTFIFAWNDFLYPLIYLLDPQKWTLPLGLRAFQVKNDTQWNLLMAASALTSLPLLILYFLGQENFNRGFSIRSGIK